MNRKDYRKMMQRKKMNKLYSRSLILGLLGLGVTISGNTIVKAESREWKANTSTTIKAGDTEYKIVWGDTLSLISRDSGITIETLTKLNNILDANLIYEGNILIFGNGATATVKDSSGNTIAETPLTSADKTGIKEAQNNNTNSTNNATTSNVNTGNNSNNVSSNTTNNSNSENSNSGNNTSNKPTTPNKPQTPSDKPENGDNGSGTEKPEGKEYTITVNYLTEDGTLLSKEVVKSKENTTFEAKAKKFEGYKLLSTDTQSVKVTEDMTITFIYKKVDNTKPEVEKVNVTIKYIGDDGKVLGTETVKSEKGSTVKADAKDFTDLGYVLDDSLTKEIKAEEGATITFNYRKIVTPTPVEKFQIITRYVDVDGNSIADNKVQEVEKGATVTEEAISIKGYKIKGNSTQSVVANSNETITFVYEKDAEYVPIHTEETITQVIDADTGANLGTTVPSGYTVVSETTDGGKTTTAPNGDTHTVYTKTITVKKDYVPQHTEEYVTVNVDTDGNVLSSTVGYEKVSESTDGGKVTTQPNGDTHTVYTTTVVWKKQAVTPPTGVVNVDPAQFGGRVTSASEVEGALTSNALTFATWDGANDYGVAMQEANPYNTDFDGFNVFSIKMKDGSTRYVMEWHINL